MSGPSGSGSTGSRLTAIHSPEYVNQVWALAKSGGGDLDPDTVVSPCSYDVALLAAGCACDATERVLRGEDRRALCLVRPPGHHALANRGMGFCLFNNVAIAAQMALAEFGLDRVLVVDWDIHHGNGTQASFYQEPRVGYLSIHRDSVLSRHRGGGRDRYRRRPGNHAQPAGPLRHFARGVPGRFTDALETFAAKLKPQLVLVSAGFDTHRLDPVGSLGLETEDFVPLTDLVLDAADAYAEGRLVSVLEGGYDPPILADSVAAHLGEMITPETVLSDTTR